MVRKEEIRTEVEASLRHFDRTGAALLLALGEIEIDHPEDALDHLFTCQDRLDASVDACETALERASDGIDTGLIRGGRNFLDDAIVEDGRLLFDHLERDRELRSISLADEPALSHFETATVDNDPISGYTRFLSLMTVFRGSLEGLIQEIEREVGVDRIRYSAWKTTTQYVRARNYVQLLEFVNAETRTPIDELHE